MLLSISKLNAIIMKFMIKWRMNLLCLLFIQYLIRNDKYNSYKKKKKKKILSSHIYLLNASIFNCSVIRTIGCNIRIESCGRIALTISLRGRGKSSVDVS